MSDSIRLHPKLGVNPKITTCPICRKDSGLVLLGVANYHDTCCDCDAKVYGGINALSPCPKCGCKHGRDRTYLEEHESRINAPMLCSECKEHMKTRIALILAEKVEGGVKYLGPMVWIEEEAWRKIVTGAAGEQSLKMRVAYLGQETWDKLGLPYEAPSETETNKQEGEK